MNTTMPPELKFMVLVIGMSTGLFLLGGVLWSIAFPEHRFWPPKKATPGIKLCAWMLTISIFLCAFLLGVFDWNRFGWNAAFRWGAGLLLILTGHLVVWSGVFKIGMRATSGESDTLETDGLYAWSRNPQYVADILHPVRLGASGRIDVGVAGGCRGYIRLGGRAICRGVLA